jgi:fused signal recognition particle receptor
VSVPVRELIYLGIAFVVIALLIWVFRKAGERSARNADKGTQERLREIGMEKEAEAPAPRQRERRRDRPRPAAHHRKGGDDKVDKGERARDRRRREKEEAEAAAREAEEREEEEEAAEAGPADADAKAAFKTGLAKTRGGFVARLGKLFGKKKIDADVLGELEEVLFSADIGPRAADRIFQSVKQNLSKDELSDPQKIWSQIRKTSATILDVDAPQVDFSRAKPFVLLILGVNGVGKTTTIGKLAAKLVREGKKVLLAAGDTFRAAATEQLEVWGDRARAPVVKGKAGGDPSSVIFDAVKRGQDEGFDVVICDTAGRLHTKVELMDELKKVRRVLDKAMPGCPHETWLVLDATTGQNAIQQAATFKDAMEITGLVLTKLDGSSKGGVILGICDELKVPVRFVGIGEKVDDLRPFDPAAFVEALYDDAEHADAA